MKVIENIGIIKAPRIAFFDRNISFKLKQTLYTLLVTFHYLEDKEEILFMLVEYKWDGSYIVLYEKMYKEESSIIASY